MAATSRRLLPLSNLSVEVGFLQVGGQVPQHVLIWLAECVVLGDDGRIGPMVLAHGQPGQVDRLLVGLRQFNVAAVQWFRFSTSHQV